MLNRDVIEYTNKNEEYCKAATDEQYEYPEEGVIEEVAKIWIHKTIL